MPTLLDLGNRQRTQVVTRVRRGHERDVCCAGMARPLPAVQPFGTKFLKNCHNPNVIPRGKLKQRAGDYSLLLFAPSRRKTRTPSIRLLAYSRHNYKTGNSLSPHVEMP